MSARDVIADWLSDAAIQNGFENSRGKSINDHADAILSALDKAGYAVVPQTFSTNAVAAIRDTVKPHIKRHDVRCDDGNEILGDAGDEAAGGSSSNADKATEAGGARCATTSASAPATTHCPVCNGKGWDRFDSPCPPCEAAGRVPATDPAPAVCVWTPRKNMGWFQPSCRKSRMHETSAALKICPSCGLPIKFTEAQR